MIRMRLMTVTMSALMGVALTCVMLLNPHLPEIALAQGTSSDSAPVEAGCTTTSDGLNMRSGPSVRYDVVDSLARNSAFAPLVRSEDSTWVFGTGERASGWVSASLLRCSLDIAQLPALSFSTEPCAAVQPDTGGTDSAQSGASGADADGAAEPSSTTPSAPARARGSVTLLAPLGDVLQGSQTFKWQSSLALTPVQSYELVFWRANADPMTTAFGLVGARPETEASVNLDKAARFLPQLEPGATYRWGVLLVETEPYRRLEFLGGSEPFTFQAEGGAGGGGNGGSAPGVAPK